MRRRTLAALRILTALALALTASARGSAGGEEQEEAREPRTYVFVCDDQTHYVVRVTGAEAWVFRPEGTIRLPAEPGGGEARFSDGSFVLRIEGERAWLGAAGGVLSSCRNDRRQAVWERARLDGADFRAVGNEPGWTLEIFEGSRLVLVADYGDTRLELTLPEPSVDAAARKTRWETSELILEVVSRRCRDSMSGEEHESEVWLTWQGRALRGCGRALH